MAVAAIVVAGCYQTEDPPRRLEIGVRDGTVFRPLHDGDALTPALIFGGLISVEPSLRAVGIDPHLPEVDVEIRIDGLVVGSDLGDAPRDMEWDGTGHTLWNVRTALSVELCCFACREGVLTARLRDASGARFEGSLRVLLGRGTCPDPAACCPRADYCPAPLLGPVCE